MLMRRKGARQRGLNLVEVMIVLTILGVLLAAGLPLVTEGLRDSRIRAAAESLISGLRIAQSEALKRNSTFRFQLVTNLESTCAVSETGPSWVVTGAAADTKCHLTNPAADPFTLRRDQMAGGDVALESNGTGAFCFSGLGRPTITPAGCSDNLAQSIDVRQSGGTCRSAGGDVRCLRVVVTAGGSIRMCDPSVNSLQDPRSC